MKAVVVYESHWGNTAAIAQAIADGIGSGTRALNTDEATREALAGVDLIVAGSPVIAFALPRDGSLNQIAKDEKAPVPPDTSHPLLRTWLAQPARRPRVRRRLRDPDLVVAARRNRHDRIEAPGVRLRAPPPRRAVRRVGRLRTAPRRRARTSPSLGCRAGRRHGRATRPRVAQVRVTNLVRRRLLRCDARRRAPRRVPLGRLPAAVRTRRRPMSRPPPRMTCCSGSAGTRPWTASLNVRDCRPAPWARSRVFPANEPRDARSRSSAGRSEARCSTRTSRPSPRTASVRDSGDCVAAGRRRGRWLAWRRWQRRRGAPPARAASASGTSWSSW